MPEGTSSPTTSPPPARSSPQGWRGGGQQLPPRHQWQRDAGLSGETLVGSRTMRKFRVIGWFVAATILLAILVWYLLHAPVQTPVVAVAATRYTWPLVPNAFAAEDLANLRELDDKTLRISDRSDDWRSARQGLTRLQSDLADVARHGGRAETVVVYLSMHGAVDAEGEPCLIPPDASPHDSRTWVRLQAVFQQFEEAGVPAAMNKLVVLDTSRELVNWNTGVIYSGFAESLAGAVERAGIPNLAVLVSSGPGQSAAASPALRASVFGHFLRLGLAGVADSRQFGGNGNGRVALQELVDYLDREVNAWTMHHEGMPQRPLLVPPAAQFNVAWALRRSAWRALLDRGARIERAVPPVPDRDILELWSKLDGLRAARPWRFDPVAWRQLQHDLLWLEQLAAAGSAYESSARQLLAELKTRLSDAEARHAKARRSGSLPDYAAVISGQTLPVSARAHSLPLATFWGTIDRDTAGTLGAQLERCASDPSPATIGQTLQEVEAVEAAAGLEEVNYLAVWQRLAAASAWTDPSLPSAVLRLRKLAEACATPSGYADFVGDERAHAWVRPRLEPLDRQRRQLEDAVLLGPGHAEAEVPPVHEVEPALTSLASDERTSRVWAERDELWSDLPYLAAWLCRPQSNAATQEAADKVIRDTLLPLVSDALRLEAALQHSDDGDDLAWTAEGVARSVRERLSTLRGEFQAALSRAADATGSQAVHEVDAILSVPLCDWATRQRLRQKRLELHLQLASNYNALKPAGDIVLTRPTAATISLLDRIELRWPEHPLVKLLARVPEAREDGLSASGREPALSTPADAGALEKTANDPSREAATASTTPFWLSVARQGELIRSRYRRLAGTDGPTRLGGSGMATLTASEARDRAELGEAESQLRSAAALSFPPPASDAVKALLRADLQSLLLWRAKRSLDDFHGPGRRGAEPLFAVAAADYLAAARQLGPLSALLAEEAAELDDLLARRRVAAHDALAVAATDILLVEQVPTVSSLVEVRARLPEAVADLPEGTAAVFLADPSGRLGQASGALVLPKTGTRPEETLVASPGTLETTAVAGRSPILHAIATLRGNDFVAPVLLRAPGGVEVEVARPAYGPPQISVAGYEQKRASLVFILDCSNSMGDPTAAEGPDGSQQPRMDAAKGALRSLLADLAERGSARVGVRFFGHRVGWSKVEPNKLMPQTGYAGEIAAELRPYADVEKVLPLGRFDSIAAGQVSQRLESVRAWGETPLYLALREAIGDFGPQDDASRSIVVITDGQNYQFNPPPQFNVALADVISAAEQARVAIHIVGFEIPAAEAQAASRDFREIASRTGGSFVPAAGATALIETLQSILRPGEFRVQSAEGTVVTEAELGRRVTLRDHTGRQQYVVAFEGAEEPVELAGGEVVELALRRGERRLEVVPNVPSTLRSEAMVTAADQPAGVVARAHRAVRGEASVRFPFSLQHEAGHFVARPAEYWVEIEPDSGSSDSQAATYFCYDSVWQPGTSVPLADLLAGGWPAGARRAELRLWCKLSATPPTYERALAEVADRLPAEGPGFALPGVPGVTYQVRTVEGGTRSLTVGVIERHDERSAGIGSLKVTLSPPADHIRHQFDPKNRIALHTYTYSRADEALRDRLTVQFTTREAAQQGAWRTMAPIIVDVSDRSDLLQLTPVAER